VLGLAVLSPTSSIATSLHVLSHAFGKITLFLCAGAVYASAGKKYISELDGIGKAMPFTMGAFFIASLSLIGVPPFAGFWSKLMLLTASGSGSERWAVIVYTTSSLLTAAYLLPISFRAFAGDRPAADSHVSEASLCLLAPLLCTCLVTAALFLGLPREITELFL
jgi:multicomponent Na+:H+ antiporter subunit D